MLRLVAEMIAQRDLECLVQPGIGAQVDDLARERVLGDGDGQELELVVQLGRQAAQRRLQRFGLPPLLPRFRSAPTSRPRRLLSLLRSSRK